MSDQDIHICSYSCERPECIRAQRDELAAAARSGANVSNTTQQLIDLLTARDAAGRAKYGTTLDRDDLTSAEWLQHMAEELLDAAGYALAAKRTAEKDAAWLNKLEEFVGPGALSYMRRNFAGDWEQAHG